MNIKRRLASLNIRKLFIEKPNWTVLFLFGFFAGIIVAQIIGKDNTFMCQLFPNDGLVSLKDLKIDHGELLFYVMKERIVFIITMLCLSTTGFGIVCLWVVSVYIGFACGLVITSAVMQYGIAGCFLAFAAAFPQILMYWPATYILFEWCYGLCSKIHSKERAVRTKSSQGKRMKWYMRILVFCLVVITGVLSECYVNTFLFKMIIKLFLK